MDGFFDFGYEGVLMNDGWMVGWLDGWMMGWYGMEGEGRNDMG